MSADGPSAHPRLALDEYLSLPVRLSIAAALARVDDAEFGTVRDAIEVSDAVLSKQVTILGGAGYVHVRKGYVGKRPRTDDGPAREARGRRRHVAGEGFEPSKAKPTDLQSAPIGRSGNLPC